MPFPLTFLAGKNLVCPTYHVANRDAETCDFWSSLSLHYAIKGPGIQNTDAALSPFDHVTEGMFSLAFVVAWATVYCT
jgi:hypothetical protein